MKITIKKIILTTIGFMILNSGADETNAQNRGSHSPQRKSLASIQDSSRISSDLQKDNLLFKMKKRKLIFYPTKNPADSNSMMKKGQRKRKDKFIDRDGDGICDGRESVFGLRKMYRNRKRRGNKFQYSLCNLKQIIKKDHARYINRAWSFHFMNPDL